jgi:hypothetical protein
MLRIPFAGELFLLVALGVFVLPTVAAAQSKPPHIALVMADDMGWGQTGYRGHPRLKTPPWAPSRLCAPDNYVDGSNSLKQSKGS